MSQDAPLSAGTREPVETPPIKATFHINNTQGIQVPEGLFPEGKVPTPAVDERQLETYRKFGVSEDVIKQVADRQAVSEMEYRLAQHRLASLKGDPAFVRKYLDGGVDERRTMMTLSLILSSSIKEEEKK
jgi:hypothetical protein